jgi:hypothetical protein
MGDLKESNIKTAHKKELVVLFSMFSSCLIFAGTSESASGDPAATFIEFKKAGGGPREPSNSIIANTPNLTELLQVPFLSPEIPGEKGGSHWNVPFMKHDHSLGYLDRMVSLFVPLEEINLCDGL